MLDQNQMYVFGSERRKPRLQPNIEALVQNPNTEIQIGFNPVDNQIYVVQEETLPSFDGLGLPQYSLPIPQAAPTGTTPLQTSNINYGKPMKTISKPDIQNMIIQEAKNAGVSSSSLLAMAHLESSFRPDAGAKSSSAKGLFQFIDSTAKRYGLNSSNVFDPVTNTRAGIQLMKDNSAQFRKAFGHEPTTADLYLMHQQGFEGLSKILKNPNANASKLLGAKKVALNGGNAQMSAKDFYDMWGSKVANLESSYRKQFGLG